MKETFGAAPSPRKRHDSGTFKIGEGPRTGLDRPKKPVIAEVDEFDFSIPEVVEEGSVGTEFDPLDQAGQEYDPIAQKIDAGIGRGLLEARAKRARAIPEITNLKRLPHFPGSAAYQAEQRDIARRSKQASKEEVPAVKRSLPHFPGSASYQAEQRRLKNEAPIEVVDEDLLPTSSRPLPHFPGSKAYLAEQARLDEDRAQLVKDAIKRYPSAQKEADAIRRAKRLPSINEEMARQKKMKEAKADVMEVLDEDILPVRLPHFPGSASYKAEQARLQKERRAKLKEALPRGLPRMPKKKEVLEKDGIEELDDAYLAENIREVVELPSSLLKSVPPPVPEKAKNPIRRIFDGLKNLFSGENKAA